MFELKILLTSQNLFDIKHELQAKLPLVKSSHRCEALARGLGFKTYAAALAAGKCEPIIVHTYGNKFRDYLAEHGFEVSPNVIHKAVAKVALSIISGTHGNLTYWGIGFGDRRRRPDGIWETTEERNIRFLQDRKELTSEAALIPFLAALAMLASVKATKTIRSGTGSYRLKHIAENYPCTFPEGEKLGPTYVSNGVFIAAAMHAGFKMKTQTDELGREMLNVNFNMSKRELDDLDCKLRPDEGLAQYRRRKEELREFRAKYGRSSRPF